MILPFYNQSIKGDVHFSPKAVECLFKVPDRNLKSELQTWDALSDEALANMERDLANIL